MYTIESSTCHVSGAPEYNLSAQNLFINFFFFFEFARSIMGVAQLDQRALFLRHKKTRTTGKTT